MIEEAADDSDDNGGTEAEKGGPESFDEKRETLVSVPAKVEMPLSPVHVLPVRSMAGGGDLT